MGMAGEVRRWEQSCSAWHSLTWALPIPQQTLCGSALQLMGAGDGRASQRAGASRAGLSWSTAVGRVRPNKLAALLPASNFSHPLHPL